MGSNPPRPARLFAGFEQGVSDLTNKSDRGYERRRVGEPALSIIIGARVLSLTLNLLWSNKLRRFSFKKVVGVMGKIIKFLQEVKAELKKVSWSTKDELIASTTVVIVTVIMMSCYIGLVDFILARLMGFIIK